MELGGGADGRLFGLDAGSFDRPRSLFELRSTTGEVENERAFGTGTAASSLALVRFESLLYGFVQHAPDERSHVFSFELDGGKATEHDPVPFAVIGAGASTCAADSERLNP